MKSQKIVVKIVVAAQRSSISGRIEYNFIQLQLQHIVQHVISEIIKIEYHI
jgi:hypothetical protein